jgi:hypothetical protein
MPAPLPRITADFVSETARLDTPVSEVGRYDSRFERRQQACREHPQKGVAVKIETVGIVGAGTMGNGIGQVAALAGLKVVLVDVTDAALAKGVATLTSSLARLVEKGKVDAPSRDAALTRIQTSTDYQRLAAADIVIEAATENADLKIRILRQIEAVVRDDAIIASNTSSISITTLAATIGRPERLSACTFSIRSRCCRWWRSFAACRPATIPWQPSAN